MPGIKHPRRVLVGALGIVAAAGIVGGAFYAHSAATPAKAASPFNAHPVSVKPTYVQETLVNDSSSAAKLRCQLPVGDPGRVNSDGSVYTGQCYGPDQMRKAYDIQPLLDHGINGAGRTIVIIDAYQSPTLRYDLQHFDALFGLPDPTLNIITPNGVPNFDFSDGNQVGWASEISLDVEWAHAIAPGATIDLVEAPSNQDADLLAVTQWVVDHNLGDVISQSFGEAESCADPNLLKAEHKVFQEATQKGMTIFASAGDQGAAQPTCDGSSFFLSASTPASDPLVTSVGGTHLNADLTTGAYSSEGVWNDAYGAGGGGFSTIYSRPSYQAPFGVSNSGRGVPDVTYNADVQGGVPGAFTDALVAYYIQVAANYNPNEPAGPKNPAPPSWFDPSNPVGSTEAANVVGYYRFGGTSAGSPQWAAITALAAQMAGGRLGFINDALYHINKKPKLNADFHDITDGNNSFTWQIDTAGDTQTVTGYDAASGWDAASGLGSLDVAKLAQDLISTHVGNDGSNL